jgi:hypothetical protein
MLIEAIMFLHSVKALQVNVQKILDNALSEIVENETYIICDIFLTVRI